MENKSILSLVLWMWDDEGFDLQILLIWITVVPVK